MSCLTIILVSFRDFRVTIAERLYSTYSWLAILTCTTLLNSKKKHESLRHHIESIVLFLGVEILCQPTATTKLCLNAARTLKSGYLGGYDEYSQAHVNKRGN